MRIVDRRFKVTLQPLLMPTDIAAVSQSFLMSLDFTNTIEFLFMTMDFFRAVK